MKFKSRFLQELYDDAIINNFVIRPSPIHGNGVFAKKPFRKGDFINTHFAPGEKLTDFGKYLNHSPQPNSRSMKQKDGGYKTYAEKDIKPNDEITLDYTVNKDLEQPQKDWNLSEKVFVREPPDTDEVEIQVDTSDQADITFSPKCDVTPPKRESADTVYGQGTNPKPEDETYLSLLKGTTKVKVKIEEEDEDKDEIEVRVSSDSGKQPNPDLNPSFYGGPKPK